MHTNENYYEYHKLLLESHEKKELSMKIDARPCNIAPEGNNIFPRRFFVNVKEASGILWDQLTNCVVS